MSATTTVPNFTPAACAGCASLIGNGRADGRGLGIDGSDCMVMCQAEAQRMAESGLLDALNSRVPDEAPAFIVPTLSDKWTLIDYLEAKGFAVHRLGTRPIDPARN